MEQFMMIVALAFVAGATISGYITSVYYRGKLEVLNNSLDDVDRLKKNITSLEGAVYALREKNYDLREKNLSLKAEKLSK